MNSGLIGYTVNIYLLLFLSVVTFGPGKTKKVSPSVSKLYNFVF